MVNVQSLVHSGAWWWGKATDSLLLPHTERGAGCGISHLLCLQSGKVWHLPIVFERDRLCWFALMMVARLPKPTTLILLNLSFDSVMNITNAGDWDTGQFSSVVTLCLGAAFACMADQRSGWLLSLLLLQPVSHYDVPQQGLLGELILIQQQIQRHEEEVRRAAAANNARPPPPEPAPSPPQQKRKVKVPTHLDLPYSTRAS